MTQTKRHSLNMTEGRIFHPIIAFAVPVILTGILQAFYNSCDMIVVGKFSGKDSLAAVGSTSSAINLLLNTFIGLSSATSVSVARKFGARNYSGVSKTVHTSIALSLFCGVILAVLGFFISRPLLQAMGSPKEVLDLATLYMQIYFAGIPAILLYNFASAILRAIGDTKRPLYILVFSGLLNMLLNLFFVITLDMDVAGVAIATILSQIFSAILLLKCLISTNECYHLDLRKMRIHTKELLEIIHLGIPAGIQSSVFSLSNIIIQSSINSVGSIAMAGSAASVSIEHFAYIAMNAFYHATLTFVSQNYGARNFKRIVRGTVAGCISVTVMGLITSGILMIFSGLLLSLYSDIPEVIGCGMIRMKYMCAFYFLCGLMEVGVAVNRGLGRAFTPMLVSILGVCGIRIVFVLTGGPYLEIPDLNRLYMSYWFSWFVTTACHFITFSITLRKRKREVFSY